MATKADFAEVEWNAIAEAPHLASLAVMTAGASGIFGSIKEAAAAARTVFESAGNPNELIRAIAGKDEMEAAQARIRAAMGDFGGKNPGEWIREAAVAKLREAIGALNRKSMDDTTAYRAWVGTVCDNVAKAAKEGGFLGFGGEQVSEKEREIMAVIRAAML